MTQLTPLNVENDNDIESEEAFEAWWQNEGWAVPIKVSEKELCRLAWEAGRSYEASIRD